MEPFGTPKRLASFPRLQPATKSRLNSAQVSLFNLRMVVRHSSGSCSHERLTSFPTKRKTRVVTIIEIRPFRNGWKCFEAPGVEPVFLDQEQTIGYAKGRARFRSGEIRIVDESGSVQRIIPFSETNRRL